MLISALQVSSAETVYTEVASEGIGTIAVRIEFPSVPRYPSGAPVVVEVGTWFVGPNGFHRVNDTGRIGAVTISYLWPGCFDGESGMQSDGEYDYGGPTSLSALKDVIRFAAGDIADYEGNSLEDLAGIAVDYENLGLFASSHAGVVATNVLAYFGGEIPGVKYLVGRENPTRDEMYPLEIGFFDGAPSAENRILNPYYHESMYFPDSLVIDYTTVGWYQPEGQETGYPYFAATDTTEEHILYHDKTPQVDGKRYYSRNLTRALWESGDLTEETWPDYVGKPAEVDSFWPYRICVDNYPVIGACLPNLRVMLVFSRFDHVQAAPSKPHIHQAWQGFRQGAGSWVRMNPDLSYLQSIDPGYGPGFPDNPANNEPMDWFLIEDWGFPADPPVRSDVWLASVAEMADRVHFDAWIPDLDSCFVPVLIDSSVTVERSTVTGDGGASFLSLGPNHPNPVRVSTSIPVYTEHPEHIRLTIFDIRGNLVEKLYTGTLAAGSHSFTWSPENTANGTYVCLLSTPGQVSRNVIILNR